MKPNREFAISTVRKYVGREYQYGTEDCNLMILETIAPDIYDALVGKYKTLLGGVRQAKKKTGFASLQEYIQSREDFVPVQQQFATTGDIGFQKFGESHDAIIHLGDALFGINEDNKFAILPLNGSVHGFQFYRRTSWPQ